MPNWAALDDKPTYTFELNDDETIVTITYAGYFTDGTTVRFGRATATQSALININPTAMADLDSAAYEDAFPPGP
jgi:hypothetical protein